MTIELMAKRGVTAHFGQRETSRKYGGQAPSDGLVKAAVWEFDYNDLPDNLNSKMPFTIPAGATIVSAKLIVDTAFTSSSTTTDLDVGLQQADGTEIDNNGLITATEATQTAIGTAGNVVTGAGALIGKTIGSAAGQLTIAPTVADLLTGSGRVIVEYVYDN